jgi:hypothetical protein
MGFPYSSGDVLTAADLNASSGLVLVKTQAVGSGVSSVTVTNAFNSTFDNYLITDNGGTMSVDTAVMFHFGATSSGANYYFHTSYGSFLSTTPQGNNGNAVSQWTQVGGSAGARNVHMTVMNAGQALYKNMHAIVRYGTVYGTSVGYYGAATAYTSFTLVALSGTMTGGTIRVYGYNNG